MQEGGQQWPAWLVTGVFFWGFKPGRLCLDGTRIWFERRAGPGRSETVAFSVGRSELTRVELHDAMHIRIVTTRGTWRIAMTNGRREAVEMGVNATAHMGIGTSHTAARASRGRVRELQLALHAQGLPVTLGRGFPSFWG